MLRLVIMVVGLMTMGAACDSYQKHPAGTNETAGSLPVDDARTPTSSGPASEVDHFIVPEGRAAEFYVGFYEAAQGYFTPKAKDIRKLRQSLGEFLGKSSDFFSYLIE